MASQLYTKAIIAVVIVFGALFAWYESVGTQTDNSAIGDLSKIINDTSNPFLSFLGLDSQIFCPYTNPYAFSLFSSGSLSVSSISPYWGAFSQLKVSPPPSDSEITNLDAYLSQQSPRALSCSNTISLIQYTEPGFFGVSCDGEKVGIISAQDISKQFNEYSLNNGEGIALLKPTPAWQCYAFFALLPFIAFYFLIMDFLNYLPFKDRRLKHLMGAFISGFVIFTGSLTNFIWNLAFISGLGIKGTFISTIFAFVVLSVIFTWIQELNKAKSSSLEKTKKLAEKVKSEAVQSVFAETFSDDKDLP